MRKCLLLVTAVWLGMLPGAASARNSCSGMCQLPPSGCPACAFRFFGGGICGSEHNGDTCSCADFACPFLSAPEENGGEKMGSVEPAQRPITVLKVQILAPRV